MKQAILTRNGNVAAFRCPWFSYNNPKWSTTCSIISKPRSFNEGEPAMKIKRKGSAAWQGGLKDGKGTISTESGALKAYPYGFAARFEGQRGSNPEELIAAAHASCFTMALSLILGEAKLTAEQMDTSAKVSLEQVADGYAVTAVHLALRAKVPGADQATLQTLAAKAR